MAPAEIDSPTLLSKARFDLREFYEDPHKTFTALRRQAPAFWYESGEFWVISTYEDIREINSDPTTFSSESGYTLDDNVFAGDIKDLVTPSTRAKLDAGELSRAQLRHLFDREREAALTAPEDPGNKITTVDPPLHTRLRRFVSRAFTPRMIADYHAEIERSVVKAFDTLQPGDEVDFVQAVSIPIPAEVIAIFLGVPPEDRADFVGWSDQKAQTFDERDPARHRELSEGQVDLRAYTKERLEVRREEPGDDMLTALLNTEIDGEKLSEADMIAFAYAFLFAGNETTRHLISGMTKLMAEHPDQRQVLVEEPDLIGGAIEEFLRYISPAWGLLRTATRDTEVAGQAIAEGDLIYLLYASANRDETVWENADKLDVRRVPDPPHMGFGWGPHRCLGANLARLEAKLTCEHLLARFPDFELAGDPVRLNSATFNGIASMPMVMK